MHVLFRGIMPQHFFAERPNCRFDEAWNPADFASMERVVEQHKDEIAAVICEPVFQGGNGMWLYNAVSFEKPTVQIKYNGSVLAQSKISKDIVTIKPQGMSVLKDMTFEIPILSLQTVSLFADMLSKAGEGFKFDKNAKLTENITNLINTLSNNVLTKLLPLLEVAMVVYVGDIAIPYSTKLS